MKALLSISLVLAIIAPGEPLHCYSCGGYGLNPRRCLVESMQPCKAHETMCMSSALRTNMIKSIMKDMDVASCVQPEDFIPGDFSLTSADNKYLHYMTYTCTTYHCNTIPDVPVNTELPLNGLQCPACFVKGIKVCESESIVNCHENETMCIDFSGRFVTSVTGATDITLKGCATKDFCRLTEGVNSVVKVMFSVVFARKKCVAAQESPSELSPEE